VRLSLDLGPFRFEVFLGVPDPEPEPYPANADPPLPVHAGGTPQPRTEPGLGFQGAVAQRPIRNS